MLVLRRAAGAHLLLALCRSSRGRATRGGVCTSRSRSPATLGAFALAFASLALRVVPAASRRELAVRAMAGAAEVRSASGSTMAYASVVSLAICIPTRSRRFRSSAH